MLTVQFVGVFFLEEKLGLCWPFPSGPSQNGEEVNGGTGETLRGEERLIGFVDHLSAEETS